MSTLDRCRQLALSADRLLVTAGLAALLACSQQPGAASAAASTPSSAKKSTKQPAKAAAPSSSPAAKPAEAKAPEAKAPEAKAPEAKPPAAGAPAAGAPAQAGPDAFQPPNGKWLVDDQGRQYFIAQVPKTKGQYVYDAEKKVVRLRWGMLYQVVKENPDSFSVKIYRVTGEPAPAAPPEPTEAEREAVAASYRTETGTSDRLLFEPFGRGLPRQGQWRNGFEIADMNGDGHPDIVHGPARKSPGAPAIFLGDGKGGWRRWTEAKFPRLAYDYGDVAVADFNGDKRMDIALGVHLHGMIVLVSDGPQSFKEWGKGLPFEIPGQGGDANGFSSRSVVAADWNGDGRPDLIAFGEGPRMMNTPRQEQRGPGAPPPQPQPEVGVSAYGVAVFLNQGDGSWTAKNEAGEGVTLFGDDLAVGDFTGDRQLDIVLSSSVFGDKEILRIGGSGGVWTRAALDGVRPDGYVSAVRIADLDKDGHQDLAVAYLSRELGTWRRGIDIFFAKPGGGWTRRPLFSEEKRSWITALDVGDLDADGNLDLAALTGDGSTMVFLGKAGGGYAREESPEFPSSEDGCTGYDVKIADLDGQPGGELVAAFAGEPSALLAPARCPNQGSLEAWKVRKRE